MIENMVLIKVTQEHIDKGCSGSCAYCPIAIAISELVSIKYTTLVYTYSFCILGLEPAYHGELPDKARVFIENYDYMNDVNPIEFELNIPAHFLR